MVFSVPIMHTFCQIYPKVFIFDALPVLIWKIRGDHFHCLCNFSVNLKVFQNIKLRVGEREKEGGRDRDWEERGKTEIDLLRALELPFPLPGLEDFLW